MQRQERVRFNSYYFSYFSRTREPDRLYSCGFARPGGFEAEHDTRHRFSPRFQLRRARLRLPVDDPAICQLNDAIAVGGPGVVVRHLNNCGAVVIEPLEQV